MIPVELEAKFNTRHPKHFTRDNKDSKESTHKKINLTNLYKHIKINNLIAITGKNGIGKTYSIEQIIYKYYKNINKNNVLFDTRFMGTDKNGHVGEGRLGRIVDGCFEIDKIKRILNWSHGQSIGDDIVSFLLKTSDKEVVFIDEPETALDFEAKQSILGVLNLDKELRPIVIATNCPFFILRSDIVFELTKDKITKWVDDDFTKLRNKIKGLI